MDDCRVNTRDRRRCFWATQPDCSMEYVCGEPCSIPGLKFENDRIETDNWIQGLVLNILNTNKRQDRSICGVNPTAIGGYWAESFIDGESGLYGGAERGYRVGTSLRYVDTSSMRIREATAHIEAILQTDLQKLVLLGVAQSVEVTVEYAGDQRMVADIEIYGPNGVPYGRVALIGQRDANMTFYWSC